MQVASGTTGLTLPGMIDDPGCNAGSSISPRPASGPEFIQRRSLAIFINATASALSWPDSSTRSSCAARPSNLLPADSNFVFASDDSALAIAPPKRRSALMPVPMAVPPIGRRRTRLSVSDRRACAESSCADQAPNSCAKVSGIASIRWVRPVLTAPRIPRARRSIVRRKCCSAGIRSSTTPSCVATRIAVGTTSFELWPMLTWSLGCTGLPPAREASLATTSLAFMLLEVPEPVWYTSMGKCASWRPSATSSAAVRIAFACPFGRWPSAALTSAAAAFTRPSARMKPRGIGRPDTGKLRTARWVCAPHSASAGTSSSPMLSCSMRNFCVLAIGRLAIAVIVAIARAGPTMPKRCSRRASRRVGGLRRRGRPARVRQAGGNGRIRSQPVE